MRVGGGPLVSSDYVGMKNDFRKDVKMMTERF